MTTTTATDDINSRLAVVETEVRNINTRLDDMQANTNARFDEANANFNAQIGQLNARLDRMQADTNANIRQLSARIDRLFQVIIAFGSGIILTLLGVIIAIIVTAFPPQAVT